MSAASARARFFAGLPAEELTQWEHALRKAVLKAIDCTKGGSFPLIEWIDRRIGGEIETRRDENGLHEVCVRGSAPPTSPPAPASDGGGRGRGESRESKEAFFATLSPDAFSPQEEAMRDAVFEFLATWTSPELATFAQLSQYPEVQRRRAAFLPRNVSLRDWIEHRIGGEIEIQGGGGRPEVVHLTESARTTVMAKFQELRARAAIPPPMVPGPCVGPPHMMPMRPAPPMGMPPMHPAAAPPPHQMGKDLRGRDHRGGAPAAAPAVTGPNEWLASLPTDELLPGELALREALLSWIKRWPDVRPASRPAGTPPHLSDAGADADIRRARAEVLPPKVKLAEWIDQRIGGEVELRAIANGQHEVFLRGAAPPPEAPRGGRAGSGGGGQTSAEEKERFWASLPADEFSEAEEALRSALLDFVDRWTGPSSPTLNDVAGDEEVKAARSFLPRGIFREWIDRRIGGEVETRNDGPKILFGRRGEVGAAKRRRVN